MKIKEMIKKLNELEVHYGPDAEVIVEDRFCDKFSFDGFSVDKKKRVVIDIATDEMIEE